MTKAWYVIYRNGSRQIEDMVTGFHAEDTALEQFRIWAKWDAVRAKRWELISFPRTCEPRFNGELRVLEFHDVLDDLDRAHTDDVRVIASLDVSELSK